MYLNVHEDSRPGETTKQIGPAAALRRSISSGRRFLPPPRISADRLEVTRRTPVEQRRRTRVVGAASRHVAGAPRSNHPRNRASACPLERRDRTQHRSRLSTAKVDRQHARLGLHASKRPHEALGEVLHMDVITDPAAVGRVPIVAVHDQLARFAGRHAA